MKRIFSWSRGDLPPPKKISRSLFKRLWILLSPWVNAAHSKVVLDFLEEKFPPWPKLYDLATAHWCATLLYERLRSHNLLSVLPKQIQKQLRSDCLENRLRNYLLKEALTALLQQFDGAGINVVLLKGAAFFTDDLFGSIGSRAMLDLDLLIRPEKIDTARYLLIAAGYEEIPDAGKEFVGMPTDQRHAHINGYRKPGTPVIVELHYNIAYGQGGRILSAEDGWQHTTETAVNGIPTLILNPTYRLLHNTVHGLIPSCDYINGRIRLWHLLEFAYLVKRYNDEIDWRAWLDAAKGERQTTAFLAWLLLANKLLAVPLPQDIPIGWWPHLQSERLMSATLLQDWGSGKPIDDQLSWLDRLRIMSHRWYYYCHLPAWVWRNVCYAEGWGNVPVRVGYFARKVVSRRSWGKV